jgi:hypothetical protein
MNNTRDQIPEIKKIALRQYNSPAAINVSKIAKLYNLQDLIPFQTNISGPFNIIICV